MSERGAPGEDNLDLFRDREAPAPRVWTVTQVNRAVRLLLEQTLPQLWVTGEVANFRRHRSGHCYFTLKDKTAQLRCVMFRREARALPTDPEEGMTLRVFGGLTLYEARGAYQFVVTRLEAELAEGMWKLAFDRLRRKLDAEGLTDPARRRPLPEFPRTVGVVTSPGSAALRDIIAVTARRAPWLRLLVRGAAVQGRGSGAGIADAITTLAGRGVDLIVVARGGGSIEDLWGFNEEPVARAVAECPVPVVSGVGHETDVTICDLVADLRAATPSAAAEAVAPDRKALARRLDGLRQRLGRTLAAQARARRWRLGSGASRLSEAVRRRVRREAGKLAAAAAAMEALSPLSTLARGYAVPLDEEGRLLRTTRDFTPARLFRLRVVDGSVPCAVAGAPKPQPGVAEIGR
ncbi:MAG: exodeoxyribonuclease VII large subunit [Gemmatimonadetes bacterium]|nr:exodeoxyribonuclease VII large subunit [Gemmatimonadota bacterium]